MSETRQHLLHRARELFNEHGLEAVGVRDLARDLDLSPGNVSYYFPRKEHLVAELMAELSERNGQNVVAVSRATSLRDLLEQYRETFLAQYDYRFLPRAVVHIVDTYPSLGAQYAAVDVDRRASLTTAFTRMVGQDLDQSTTPSAIACIVGTCAITARFWLSEMRLSFNTRGLEPVINHYLAIIAHAVWAPATPAARKTLVPFLDGAIPAVADHRPETAAP